MFATAEDPKKAEDLIKKVQPREQRSVGQWIRDTYYCLRKDDGRWTHSRTENIFRGVARRIDAWEMDSMRRIIQANEREEANVAREIKTARAEYQELRARYESQKRSMVHTDADFFGPQLDALALKIARFIAPEISGDE